MIQLNPGIIRFTGKINNAGGGGAFVNFPFNVEEIFGIKGRVPVNVIFEKKIKYKGSLVKMGTDYHMLIVLKSIREQLNKTFEDNIDVELELDTSKRTVLLPDYLTDIFENNKNIKDKFEKLSFSHQKEFITWLESAKKQKTRDERLKKFIEMIESK